MSPAEGADLAEVRQIGGFQNSLSHLCRSDINTPDPTFLAYPTVLVSDSGSRAGRVVIRDHYRGGRPRGSGGGRGGSGSFVSGGEGKRIDQSWRGL